MKLVFLIGDAAVGKMTVGQELMKCTGLRLFHNHMMIEPVIEIFGSFNGHVTQQLREVIFHEFAKSDNKGMIFTYLWAFDMQSDWDYVAHVADIFKAQGAEIFYAELIAPQDIRLQRNETENRLRHKASKRELESSRARLLRDDANHRCVSLPGEIPFENYFRIDNSTISAEEAAVMIKERFGL